MSTNFALWKCRKKILSKAEKAMLYLLLSEGLEGPGAEELPDDIEEQLHRIATEFFPGRADPPFDSNVYTKVVSIEAPWSTAEKTSNVLRSFAQANGYEFFDPLEDEIPKVAQQEFERILNKHKAEAHSLEQEITKKRLQLKLGMGDAKAMVEMGNRYYFGDGMECNLEKAAEHYRFAAESGHQDGMHNFADCLIKGEGVERNVDEALAWFEKALKKDPIFTAFTLGEHFLLGNGVTPNKAKAIFYFELALKSGNQDAKSKLRELGVLPPP